MESKRMLVVPDRSLGGVWHGGCPKDISRKLRINCQVCTFLGSAPSTMCLQSIIMESKRMLDLPERSLGGFFYGGSLQDKSRKLHINFQVSTLLESLPTPGFSRASSMCHLWSLRGCWKFLSGVLVVFDMVDVSNTSRKLRINFQFSTCPGNSPSPMCLQSVIMESKRTLEVLDRSLGGF